MSSYRETDDFSQIRETFIELCSERVVSTIWQKSSERRVVAKVLVDQISVEKGLVRLVAAEDQQVPLNFLTKEDIYIHSKFKNLTAKSPVLKANDKFIVLPFPSTVHVSELRTRPRVVTDGITKTLVMKQMEKYLEHVVLDISPQGLSFLVKAKDYSKLYEGDLLTFTSIFQQPLKDPVKAEIVHLTKEMAIPGHFKIGVHFNKELEEAVFGKLEAQI